MTAPVLIVDDHADTVDVMRAVLEAHGFAVVSAPNGLHALDLLLAMPVLPCVVLLDLTMPEMNGWDLLALMRSYTRLSKIPVIIVTATVFAPSSRPSYDSVLTKPVANNVLVATVRRVLRGHG